MATKQRKIEINYRLLQTSCNIEVVGSVPDMQVYQADKAEYTPDYTLTPLVLFPRCNATDPEAVTKIGAVNSRLTNMKWYERIGTTRTLITSTNTGYSITESGDSKGQITMKKNVTVLKPVTPPFCENMTCPVALAKLMTLLLPRSFPYYPCLRSFRCCPPPKRQV